MHISWIHICHCNYVETFFTQVITTSHSRTWRISIFEAALTLGLVAGSMTSGLIIDHLDLPALFGITAGNRTFEQGGCCEWGDLKSCLLTFGTTHQDNPIEKSVFKINDESFRDVRRIPFINSGQYSHTVLRSWTY